MAPIITTLLTAGPALIRLFGQSKGGNTEFAAETIAEVLERVKGVPANTATAKIQSVVDSLDPTAVTELKLGLAKIQADREKAVFDHDIAMHQAQQQTLQSPDVKGVRPQIANRHSWFTVAYYVGAEAAQLMGYGTGASMEIGIAIAAPTLAWFGFRTFDKFSKQGASL